MAVVDIYAQVAANLDHLSELTGKKWDLLMSEQELDYQLICGSTVVGRAPWIAKVHELISSEVSKRMPKVPKKRRKLAVKPVVVLIWSNGLCILSWHRACPG